MIDLHCHTKISDGSLAPFELIRFAKLCGISHLAITDHDTARGIPEAVFYGRLMGVAVIPGIEISAYDLRRNHRVHILGLDVAPDHPVLEQLCRGVTIQRHQASMLQVRKLREAGFNITWEEVEKYAAGGTGVYKQHIMHALVDRGYCRSVHGALYRELFGTGDQSSPAGPAFPALDYPDVFLAIAAVRAAGGIAVLAHPGLDHNFEAVADWAAEGLQGIEAYHPDHTPADEELSLAYAKRFDLIVTGGTDYHGIYDEKARDLGCSKLGLQVIAELKNRQNDAALSFRCG